MNKEEYIKYVENNEESSSILETNSTLYAILEILIRKGICKMEEFEQIKKIYKKKIIERSYARESQEDLEAVKTINDFMNMFGFGGK